MSVKKYGTLIRKEKKNGSTVAMIRQLLNGECVYIVTFTWTAFNSIGNVDSYVYTHVKDAYDMFKCVPNDENTKWFFAI